MRRAGQLAARSFSELCHHHLCSVPSESICSHALSSSPTGRFLGWYRWQATLRPEHKLALNEALGGYGARTSWSRRIINTSSSALNGGGQEINGSGDASTQQHHGKQEGTVERSSGEASTSTAVQRSDNIDMSQFWTEDQKRRAALLDTYVNEAFKERPR